MKTYQKVEIEILQVEEDIVRTSEENAEVEKNNRWDDLINFNFGA